MSRGVFLLGVGVAVVALAFAMTDWAIGTMSVPGVMEAKVRRIKPRMTFAEVEAILGGPGRFLGGGNGFYLASLDSHRGVSA